MSDIARLTQCADRLEGAAESIMAVVGEAVAEAMGDAFDLDRANDLCERTENKLLAMFAPSKVADLLRAIAETYAHYRNCQCAEASCAHGVADEVLGVAT